MKRNLFLSLLVMGLTFLGISTAGATQRDEDDLVRSMQSLSVSGSQAPAAVPNPHIMIDGQDLLRIEGFFTTSGDSSMQIRLRTAVDSDFYLGDDKDADPEAIRALGDLTPAELGAYRPNKLGPVTIQRRNPRLMAFYENGTRKPADTIGSHWPNIWKKRLQNHSPSTLYVLEELREGGTVRFIGHIGLGHQSDTQWVLFAIFGEEDQRRGIGKSAFEYVLRTFIPALYGNPIVGPKVAGYNSLLLKTDNESPITHVVGAEVERLRAEGYHVDHKENAERPGGRKGHEVEIDLRPVREKAQAQQAATVSAAEGSAEPFTPPAGTQ